MLSILGRVFKFSAMVLMLSLGMLMLLGMTSRDGQRMVIPGGASGHGY